ncbi:5028_t:CDS:2 [Ambispora gerdemannii]|uniref:5028_t:CDS:1 n=1 Tax=Ambispora gerdemannii TaxID=144530 RepID=A0A9N8WPA5_9GLOM|nr:5028_t:CDS:2 [Ambispora gerdemannii]
MFLHDAIFNKRTTEPLWFKTIKALIALIATLSMIFYFTQLNRIRRNYNSYFDTIEFDKGKLGLNLDICLVKMNVSRVYNNDVFIDFSGNHPFEPFSLNNENVTSFCENIITNFDNPFNTTWITVSDIFNHLKDDKLTHSQDDKQIKYMIELRFKKVQLTTGDFGYNTDNSISFKEHSSIYVNFGSITQYILDVGLERHTIPFFDSFSDSKELVPNAVVNYRRNLSFKLDNTNTTLIGINANQPMLMTVFESNGFLQKSSSIVSKMGGFYTAVVGIFVLFFGDQRVSPWGLAQTCLFSCTPCRRSLKEKLARKYVSSAGIPFSEKVKDKPENSSLEARVQILETLLKEYYLNTALLDKVKQVIVRHPKYKKEYEELTRALLEQDDDVTIHEGESSDQALSFKIHGKVTYHKVTL